MFIVISCLALVIAFASRVLYVIRLQKLDNSSKRSARTLIVLGSGGHTAEMIRHLIKLDPNLYRPRLYIVADSDLASKSKVKFVESRFDEVDRKYSVEKITRSRNVNQSYFTSIFTTIYSTLTSIPIVFLFKPDLILCNGPGICIPVCLIGFLLKVLFICDTKIVFIESICRVKTLSLSGKILLRFADKVLVQWPELKEKYPKAEYIGLLL